MPPNQDNPATPTDPNVPGDQLAPTMPDPLQPAEVPQAPADLQPQMTSPSPEPSMDGAAYGQGSFQPTDVPEAPAVPDTMPDPIAAAQPTPLADTPAASPVQPDAAPTMAPAPTNDPTQPGYVPPVVSPAAAPTMQQASSPGSKAKILRLAIVAIVTLFLLAGGGYLLKDTLFTGSQIKVSDLVEDSANGVSFKRPSNWIESSDKRVGQTAYTEQGKAADETDQVLLVGSQSVGANYDNLSDADKTKFYDQVKASFGDKSAFEDDTCQEASTPEVSKVSLSNYTDGISISVTCEKFSKRNVRAQMKMVIGLKERQMSLVAVLAVDKTWDKSGDALDEILTTFKPAEE
jgi:hypothetical protein